MPFPRFFTLSAFSVFLSCSLSASQTQNETRQTSNKEEPALKAINTPTVPYPEEARKNRIEGKVKLSIVIDANGKVSQAKVLSGPKELVPAALASVKMWEYEPPAAAPVTKTVEVGYGFPKECPGPISEMGGIEGNGRLSDKNGKLVAVVDSNDYPLPPYPVEERKSGAVGEMILWLTLTSDGHVKEIHAAKSLSPGLDKAAIDMVRTWRFKGCQGEPLCGEPNPNIPLEDLQLKFIFSALCHPVL